MINNNITPGTILTVYKDRMKPFGKSGDKCVVTVIKRVEELEQTYLDVTGIEEVIYLVKDTNDNEMYVTKGTDEDIWSFEIDPYITEELED